METDTVRRYGNDVLSIYLSVSAIGKSREISFANRLNASISFDYFFADGRRKTIQRKAKWTHASEMIQSDITHNRAFVNLCNIYVYSSYVDTRRAFSSRRRFSSAVQRKRYCIMEKEIVVRRLRGDGCVAGITRA